MLLLKAALLCSLYIPQVNLLTLGFSNIKESPSEVQSISGLAEYEYPLLEKLWTRIGAPHTSMQKQSNVIPLIHKDGGFDTNRVNTHTGGEKSPGLWLNWTQSAIWRLAAPCWAQARQRAIASHAARTAAVCLLVCARTGPHTHIYGPLANKTVTRTPLSLFNLTDRSRKNVRLFVPVPIRDIPGARSALRNCCLCVCVSP